MLAKSEKDTDLYDKKQRIFEIIFKLSNIVEVSQILCDTYSSFLWITGAV